MSKEAMKLALEEIKIGNYNSAAERLEAALAEQPAQQEPVAWRAWFDADHGARWLFSLWPEEERLDVAWQPLYTSPQPAQPSKPLTDEQRRETINHAWNEYLRGEGHDSFGWYLSQAIEDAHNIKENT